MLQVELEEGSRKQEKEERISNTEHSQPIAHTSTNPVRRSLTSMIEREPVLSTWYGRRRRQCLAPPTFTLLYHSHLISLHHYYHHLSSLCCCVRMRAHARPPHTLYELGPSSSSPRCCMTRRAQHTTPHYHQRPHTTTNSPPTTLPHTHLATYPIP